MKGLLDLISPVTWYVAVIAVVVFGLHLNWQDGFDQGYAKGLGEGDAAITKMRLDHSQEQQRAADAAAKSATEALESLRIEQERGDQLASQLADTRATLRKTTDQLNGEIPRVTTWYRRTLTAPAEPLPAGVFTNGFVRVWNSANGISTSVRAEQAPIGAAASTNGAGAVDGLDSGVTQPLVLANQIRNGELHSSCRAQLNRLIEWTLNGSN